MSTPEQESLKNRLTELEQEYTEITGGRDLVESVQVRYQFDDGARATGLGEAVAEAERQISRVKKVQGAQ